MNVKRVNVLSTKNSVLHKANTQEMLIMMSVCSVFLFFIIITALLLSTSRINHGDDQTVLRGALRVDIDSIFQMYLNYFKNRSTKPHT